MYIVIFFLYFLIFYIYIYIYIFFNFIFYFILFIFFCFPVQGPWVTFVAPGLACFLYGIHKYILSIIIIIIIIL